MPNLANAKKALRQSTKRAERNAVLKNEMHSLRRRFRKHIESGEVKEAEAMIPELYKKLDKIAQKNIFKKNKSSRLKSRLVATLKRAQAK
jgi:small subunit ribosomal protein S20